MRAKSVMSQVRDEQLGVTSPNIDPTTARPSSMKTPDIPHQFIVIEGPIGVGKTSLARLLCASLEAEPVLEQAAENPFLERFYRNPRDGALPTQLYFLFQRAQQLAALNQQDMFAP